LILQIITEHQGHILIRIVVIVAMFLGFLFIFGYFNRKRKNTSSEKPEIINFSRKNKKKRRKGGKKS